MADQDGIKRGTLVFALHHEPYRFDFQQAMRLLEAYYADSQCPGDSKLIQQEMLQLKSKVFLSAPPSDIYSFDPQGRTSLWKKPVLEVNFIGLAGIQGPLPLPFTELILDRLKVKDFALDDFIQIFNHRILALYRKIYKKTSLMAQDIPMEKTDIGFGIRSFSGIGLPSLSCRLSFQDTALLGFAGLIWQKPFSSAKLSQIIGLFFNIPVRTEEFVAQWENIPLNDCTKIGRVDHAKQLGKDSTLGRRFWNQISGLVIHIGPLTLKSYRAFFPAALGYKRLVDMIKILAKPELDIWVRISLRPQETPRTKLGDHSLLGRLAVLQGQSGAAKGPVSSYFRIQ